MILNNCVFILSGYIQKDQSVLIKPISIFFGYIMNFFFEIANYFTEKHSLGISIILLTIVTRFLMLPLALKAQKSSSKMQAVAPEVEKIKKKYEGEKDSESQRKMTQEIQMLYSKNNVNMFGGCLPLLVQFPIFIALNYIMRESFMFINKLGDIYRQITELVLDIPLRFNYLVPLAQSHIPTGKDFENFDLSIVENLEKVLGKFTPAEWDTFITGVMTNTPLESQAQAFSLLDSLRLLLEQKNNIEYFMGISLLENAGLSFPGVMIPILSAVFMFLSSYLMNKQQKVNDAQTKMTQNVMLIAMPLLIGWTTISFPAGVGIYWTVSNIFQLGQQILLSKFYKPSASDKEVVKVVKDKKKK